MVSWERGFGFRGFLSLKRRISWIPSFRRAQQAIKFELEKLFQRAGRYSRESDDLHVVDMAPQAKKILGI